MRTKHRPDLLDLKGFVKFAMLETDDASIIPRARAYGNDRWREVRGLPAAPAAVEADLIDAQRKSFRCLVGIIDTPLTGNEQSDFLLRRNQVEACRVILQLKPTPHRCRGWRAWLTRLRRMRLSSRRSVAESLRLLRARRYRARLRGGCGR